MIDREDLLRRWVKQEPAPPNVQYLRDTEREAALDQLGHRTSVLDVASESGVTERIDADSVTRVDFSEDAAAYAASLLDGAVDDSAVADPESPSLPFEDDEFDGAISIGPFDWKFLDVEALVAELHRVVDDDGLLVFSVPTPRSPYANGRRNRYYDPATALDLVSPEWRLRTHDQIYQYPNLANAGVNNLPPSMQEPFVDVERRLTDVLTAGDAWNRASYLVIGVQPLDYDGYLSRGLDCLFRPVDETGFWDPKEGKFVRAWDYELADDGPVWSLDDSVEWRYAPLALIGTMQWRTSSLGTDRYDRQLRQVLTYFTDKVSDRKTREEMPSYGLGPLIGAFSLAGQVFEGDAHVETARELFEYTERTYDFDHSEDSLLLYGWTYLFEATGDESVLEAIREALWTVNEQVTGEGLFGFDNPTTRRHQNQMYALWGLCRAAEVTGSDGFLLTAERVLDYTIRERMREDGAFIWEDLPPSSALKTKAGRRLGLGGDRLPYWKFLYECHQTFFVNAVEHYYAAGGTRRYDGAVRKAMEWMYGENDLGVDLVEYSGIDVPMRFLTTDGGLRTEDQQYKGAYEIGSYVMALTSLLAGQLAAGPDTA